MNINETLKKARERTLEVFFPRRCPACHEITEKTGELICGKCRERFSVVTAPFCFKCGKEVKDEREEYCSDCKKKNPPFVRNFAAFNYNETARVSVLRFKNGGRKEYADYYAEELLRLRGGEIKEIAFDAVVPVPLSPRKKRERGYNQAEAIAAKLAESLRIPLIKGGLVKIKETGSQKELDAASRARNLRQAFASKYSFRNAGRVLLVDDVYTTGSTLSACAAALKKAGAAEVYSATVFVGKTE